jgi:hypothetical protein
VLLASMLFALPPGAWSGSSAPALTESHALTAADALLTIPDASGRILFLGDLDQDGVPELAIRRGAGSGNAPRIDAVSARDGRVLRTLWRSEASPSQLSTGTRVVISMATASPT